MSIREATFRRQSRQEFSRCRSFSGSETAGRVGRRMKSRDRRDEIRSQVAFVDCLPGVSFDKDFDKLHGVARKRPGDCVG